MNLRDAAQQALEALELYQSEMSVKLFDTAVTALHAALSDEAMQRLTDVQQEMEQPVTDCHEKEGGKLPPPLPILAVHVGYRYQSPVGGWEYGDHIPMGFDTDKWAHQKIYILQEQS